MPQLRESFLMVVQQQQLQVLYNGMIALLLIKNLTKTMAKTLWAPETLDLRVALIS